MNDYLKQYWYQIIEINGEMTKGLRNRGDVKKTWSNIKQFLPENLEGLRILDLGCNAGMYCVNSILMGAREVIGIEADDNYYRQALFVKKHMERKYSKTMNIRYVHGKIHEHIGKLGTFNIIYAFSILYHIHDSFIDHVCECMSRSTKNIIIRTAGIKQVSYYFEKFKKYGFVIHKQLKEKGIPIANRGLCVEWKYFVQLKKKA